MNLFDRFPVSLTNSIGRRKELFEPVVKGKVGMYVCGPTVYNEVHLGNLRTFLTFDLIFRYLNYLGYKVRYVRNITDVGHLEFDADDGEDKIAKEARKNKLEPMEVAQKYTNLFHDVTRLFNMRSPSIEPMASGHIIEQIEMIEKILKNGYAYESGGSVYFDVNKYDKDQDYGKLSGRKIEELISQTRELEGQEQKRNSLDFALWKKADTNHIMRWPSPWSDGFPGWHLECSVMGTKYLGQEFDIHGGGMDLKFPHHECEIAQSMGADGTEAVKYWVHGNMLTVEGKRMSKTEGNGFTPLELISGDHPMLKRGYTPMCIRFFMLQAHYASTLDFSNEALQASEKGYKRLMRSMKALQELQPSKVSENKSAAFMTEKIDAIRKHLSDDFNSPLALAQIFEICNQVNIWSVENNNIAPLAEKELDLLKSELASLVSDVLGLEPEDDSNSETLSRVMDLLMEIRKDSKLKKDFATSDKIREDLNKIGIKLKDLSNGETGYLID
jgi:cysteinyl-tRNA synthetase